MRFLDLFSGIGGFRLGMEQAGHECVGHVEIDKFARMAYQAIHRPKETEFDREDITKITDEEWRTLRGKVDARTKSMNGMIAEQNIRIITRFLTNVCMIFVN